MPLAPAPPRAAGSSTISPDIPGSSTSGPTSPESSTSGTEAALKHFPIHPHVLAQQLNVPAYVIAQALDELLGAF